MLKAFKDDSSSKLKQRISDLNHQIDDLRAKMTEYDNYSGPAFEAIRGQFKKSISELSNEKALLENELITFANPEFRANEIINELRKFPDYDTIGDFDFRNLFKKLITVNRDRLIFVIGSDDMTKIPYNPNTIPMMFIESFDYMIRSTTSTCRFGVYINK